jgi:hypothetical protein
MVLKKKTIRETETEKNRGKRRYLERIQNDREKKKEQEEAIEELQREAQERGFYEER